jgi:hypothetical protein
MFVRTRERKAATGGELIAFATRNTCLSQFCHVDGTYEKKPLKRRYHQFPDGTRVGRDLYLRLSGAVRPGWLSRCDPSGSCLDRCAKRSCERQRTDLNLREGGALAFPTSLLASERVARITVLNALARPGLLIAVAHLAAARVPQSSAAGTEAPCFSEG